MFFDKECSIILEYEKEGEIYYDILFSERNVELTSLIPIEETLKENTYAIYIKNKSMEIVLINKIDLIYNYALVQIYKSNIPSKFITF
jgi:hypothetical protein